MKLVGKPLNRVDGRAKVTGAARYAAEYKSTTLKHAVLLQSTIASGEILAVDDREARKLAGVKAIITCFNAPALKNDKAGGMDNAMDLLQSRKISHDRQNIGIVVADSEEIARHAAALVKFSYKKNAVNTSLGANLKSQTKPPDNKAMGVETDYSRGDVQAALATARHKIEAVYSTPREVHCPMEPHATTASWQKDRLTVWDATQGISGVQAKLAHIFSIPPANVRVICKFIGGGFGCKGSVWSHVPLAALASRVVGAPVVLNMSRDQTFGPVGFRPATIQTVRLGADDSGRLLAISHKGELESARLDRFVENVGLPARYLYHCDNVESLHRVVDLDIGKPTFMRAPGECTGTFALECALDELACAVGISPVDLRLLNDSRTDQYKNLPFSNKHLRRCLELGRDRFGFRPQAPGTVQRGNLLYGVGMATATYPVHKFPARARVVIDKKGFASVTSGTQDLGTGTSTIMTQIACDNLALPLEKVQFSLGDTDYPAAGVSGGSATAGTVGAAVTRACEQIVKELKELAAAQTGLDAASAKAEGGLICIGEKKLSYSEILTRAGKSELSAEAFDKPEQGAEKKYSMHSFGAHFCEVAVDRDFGSVRVTRWTGVFDAGRIFNHKTARSQINGGIIMGIGMALLEDSLMDSRYGRTINADLGEYHLPVSADIPDIDVHFIEEPDFHANPMGGHGIGEIGITGAAAAVANAVYNATGKRVRDLPLTLDRIMT